MRRGGDDARLDQGSAAPERMQPCRFHLVRDKDCSGISGEGHIADGVVFADGSVALHWYGRHGHGGLSRLVWLEMPVVQAELAPPGWLAGAGVDRDGAR